MSVRMTAKNCTTIFAHHFNSCDHCTCWQSRTHMS